jgi:glycosyltransferase involved in cell wall biosynthesis
VRLLSVIHNPVYGGAHNELLGQRAGLADAGWETIAATSDQRDSGRARLEAAGVPVVAIPLHRLRTPRALGENVALVARFAPEVRALRELIRRERIDLVQAHGVINPHAALAAHREGVAVCWHLYDMVVPAPLRRALSPLVVRYGDSATAIGRALADAHPGIERLGERLVITSPPVDFEVFEPDDAVRAEARRSLGLADDAVVVGTVGNLFPNKGHLDLLDAVEPLLVQHPALELCLFGAPSPAHAEHERLLHERVRALAPRVRLADPGDAVPRLMRALDVFVMPSHSEGMPTTLLEAMGSGIAVVATRVGAVPELVDHGHSGLLVPARDAAALRDAVRSLVTDAGRRAALGAAGRERVLAQFGLDRVVERRLRAYELALAHRRARA